MRVPDGYKIISEGRRITVIIGSLEDTALSSRKIRGRELQLPGRDFKAYTARGQAVSVEIPGCGRFVVRKLVHGGLLRKLTRDLFLWAPWAGIYPRPYMELLESIELRNKGLDTPEIVSVEIEKLGGIFYRGVVVTREIEGAQTFWDAIEGLKGLEGEGREARKKDTLRSVARVVRKMHDLGLSHADLNGRNILVRDKAGPAGAFVIDLDKSRMRGNVTGSMRRMNLKRLWRSLRKLDPMMSLLGKDDEEFFIRCYEGEQPCLGSQACRC